MKKLFQQKLPVSLVIGLLVGGGFLIVCFLMFGFSVITGSIPNAQRAQTEAGYAREEAQRQLNELNQKRMGMSSDGYAQTSGASGAEMASSPAAMPMSAESKTAGPELKPQLIKTASVTMKVDKLAEAVKQVKQLTRQLGGYATQENISLSDEQGSYRSASMTLRLPQANLDPFLHQASGIGKILNEQISATDVSKELVDTEARIRNLLAEEKALQQIMNRAGKIPEILEVARELSRVRGEIEQAQGSLSYMRGQVAYSTVNLTLSETIIASPVDSKPGIGTTTVNALQTAWDDVYSFILWGIGTLIWFGLSFLPRLAVLLVIGFGIFRLFQLIQPRLGRFGKVFGKGNKTD